MRSLREVMRGHAVAHDDPVDDDIVGLAALAARIAHGGGVLRVFDDLVADRIDAREHVEIDEAVVHRRDQRVGDAVGETAEECVRTGRVDHDEIVVVLDLGEAIHQLAQFVALGLGDRVLDGRRHVEVARHGERNALVARPAAAVFDVAGERKLPAVKINRRHGVARPQQRDSNVHGRGGLARAALLVAAHDDMGVTALSEARVRSPSGNRHHNTPYSNES